MNKKTTVKSSCEPFLSQEVQKPPHIYRKPAMDPLDQSWVFPVQIETKKQIKGNSSEEKLRNVRFRTVTSRFFLQEKFLLFGESFSEFVFNLFKFLKTVVFE